jgi:glycerol-3-phosphate acyltransferase PlsY
LSEAIGAALAFLLGGVPFAALAARLKGVDLRSKGSGNLGATNAIRVLGARAGVPVLLADVGKGFAAAAGIPALLGGGGAALPLICGAAAIAGHVWTPFLRFRGGKGVATAGGVFLALAPRGVGIAALAFAVTFLASRYVSLASMVAAVVLPLALWGTGASRPILLAGVGICALVLVRHRANLSRLAAGTEHRVRFGRSGR